MYEGSDPEEIELLRYRLANFGDLKTRINRAPSSSSASMRTKAPLQTGLLRISAQLRTNRRYFAEQSIVLVIRAGGKE